MPNVSGRELAGRFEKLRPGIKVLFMSGYSDNIIEQRGVLEEGTHFIQKPFSPEALAGKIRELLGPPAPLARILVTDSEAGVRGFLRMALESGGYEVIEAAGLEQALGQARTREVDLIIAEFVLPEPKGIESIQTLREALPGVGIIAVPDAVGGPHQAMAASLGADAVLSKPVNTGLLLARVAELLKPKG